jgi:hypothetical protein
MIHGASTVNAKLLIPLCLFALAATAEVRPGLPPGSQNTHYSANRAPLAPLPLVKLPVGAIHAGGWLGEQLRLMGDGFSGRLPELSQFCDFSNNAWTDTSGHGRFGWEELPYWLKGYIDLGYVSRDPRIISDSQRWVEAVLKSQRPDGYFGATTNLTGKNTLDDLQALDLWPNMVMLYVLRTHYEATHDARIIPFMTRYYRWFMRQPLHDILPTSWQKFRGGDNLDHIYWLYNQTGEAWLLDAARINHERTSDWVSGIASWHGVNFGECFREPAQYFQQTHDERYLKATERDYATMIRLYGQVPGGGFATDENARPGFTGPRQATETCTWAELMFSHEMLTSITGASVWADRAEEIAFNSLPASMTPDLKGLHYLTAPNQVQLDRVSKAPMIENGGAMFAYDPYSHRCCQHNTAMAWPYYAQRQWMGTNSNGLAAVFYSTNTVKARVGAGVDVTIEEQTDYPFNGEVRFVVKPAKAAAFPLALRIPAWATAPTLKLNGKALAVPAKNDGWITLDRNWAPGDRLELKLPMKIEVKRWPAQFNAASVHYGPLAFSLKIDEEWRSYGDNEEWKKFEVFPKSSWNYALDADSKFEISASKVAAQPFTPQSAPLSIRATGRRVPEWKLEPNGLAGEIQTSPVQASGAPEPITLIPMGAARLRISMFPVAGGGKSWDPNPGYLAASSASHFDQPQQPGFSWAGKRNSTEWIERRYSEPRTFTWAEAHFEGTAMPESWRWLASDGKLWKEIARGTGERVTFPAVTTRALRLEVKIGRRQDARLASWSAGISDR